MVELPLELWLYIVQFIPDATLRNVLAVNSFFYNLSMDLRYNRIVLQTTLNPRTMKLIARLSDPEVSKRVRYLTVSPDFRNYGTATARPSFSLRDRFTNIFHSFHLTDEPSRPEEEATQALINILPGMKNVTTFTIDSHSWGSHSGPELHTFLRSAWSSFGRQLKKLSLRGHAASFRTIITSKPDLPTVEELFLELIDNPLQADPVADANTLLEVVAPFINDLAPNLKALTMWCWGTLDLSALFFKLGMFPLLSVFNLQTAFPKTFRNDPTGLTSFLENHRFTLEILVLRLNTTPSSHMVSSEDRLAEWLLNSFSSIHFPTLQELQLYPSALPQGLNALTSCIQNSASTLTRLVVRERYLELEEVVLLLNTLSPKLNSLRLNVRMLHTDLFDLAAMKLPELRSLCLHVGNVSSTFPSDMEGRSYNKWKLWNLGIWQSGSTLDIHMMYIISRSIPSIHSFWNYGSMEENELSSPATWSSRNVDDGVH